jgi:hypothetical protein
MCCCNDTIVCVIIQAIDWHVLAARILSFGGVGSSGALHCKGNMQRDAPRRVQQPQCFLLHYEPARKCLRVTSKIEGFTFSAQEEVVTVVYKLY